MSTSQVPRAINLFTDITSFVAPSNIAQSPGAAYIQSSRYHPLQFPVPSASVTPQPLSLVPYNRHLSL